MSRSAQVALGIVAIVLLVALALPWGGAGGTSLATPGPARAGERIAPHTLYVVQPGDTLWAIARRLAPRSDPHVIAAELSGETGSSTIVPGERLVLP